MNDVIDPKKSSVYTKSMDVYDAYKKWLKNTEYKELQKYELYNILKVYYNYLPSTRIGNTTTSGFQLILK